MKKLAALLALAGLLTACGQTGPLYLPKTSAPPAPPLAQS